MTSHDQPAARRYGRERFEATHDPQDFLRWLNAYVNETGREDHELHALCSHAHSVIAALQNEIAALLPHAQGAAMPGSEHPAALARRATLGIRCDLDPLVEPDRVCDAHELPFADDEFDCVLLDPPYSDDEALELYGVTMPLRPAVYLREAVRVTKPGGWVCIYTDREPRRPSRCNHAMRIVVVLRPGHSPRICGVFQKRKPGMPFFGTEAGELVAA